MKRVFIWILPLGLILSLVGWRLSTKQAAAQQATGQAASRKNAPQAADIAVAGPAMIETVIEAVGNAESPFKVDISPKTSGRIDYLVVREGDPVKKGQVLVQLNPSDLEGMLLQQQAAVAESRARLAEAQISKSANDATIQGNLLEQQANLSTAQAAYEQAKQTYDAQIADAQSAVVDAQAKVSSAQSEIRNNQAKVASARADADNAKLRYERYQKLLAQGYIAGQLVDDARASSQVAEKAVDVANAELDGSRSAKDSADAQLKSAQQQLQIAKKRAEASVKTARAQVNQAEATLKVAKANQSGSAAYQENLAALSAGVRSSQAQLSQAQSKKQDMVLRSSVDGTVTARNADPGSIANAGQAILTVQSLDWLYIQSSLPIELSPRIRVGQSVRLRFDGFPDRVWNGKISQVNPSADSQTRQFTFLVRLENPERLLRPGMYAQISIPVEKLQVQVAVPKTAVQEQKGKQTVRVVDEKGDVTVRDVEIGESNDKLVQIVKGLSPGDKVVALSYTSLKEGQKVRLPGQGGDKK
jgi:RND family efflux transporter MFP subunit